MRLFIILLSLCLFGCAQTQLYFVTEGYSKDEIEQLTASLTKQFVEYDLNVQHSDIVMPTRFPDASLALNPTFSDRQFIEQLDDWLEANGHQPSREFRFAEGNHYYSENRLGLYLRKHGSDTAPKLPPYLRTQYCDVADGTLALNRNGKAILESELIGDGSDDIVTYIGDWQFNNNQLIVEFNGVKQQFNRANEIKQTHLGPRTADVFKPVLNVANPQILTCDFLIIYMN